MSAEILLWGLSGDASIQSIVRELTARGIPHVFLDQRHLHEARIAFDASGTGGRLQIAGQSAELDAIRAVYARPNDIREILRHAPAPVDMQTRREVLALDRRLYAWTEMTHARVVNRPSAASSNDSKPYQAERIREHGFPVPPTLVTTTPRAVREFIRQHGQVVYKSAGRMRSVATRLDESDLDHIDAVTHCPTQFQAYVAGVNWRVHVIGYEIHACEIHCAADDYRVAPEHGVPLEIAPATLPAPVAARCRSLTRALGLTLAGIDLIRTDDDLWYCLEVNPSPAFPYYERVAGQPLTSAIADLLASVTDLADRLELA